MKSKIFRVLAGIFFIMALVFFQQGFDKKDNYVNSESFSILNTNAYVGGDAYNYIINGTYFAGYLALGSAMMISGMISLLISESAYTQVRTFEESSINKKETINEVIEELPEI